MGWLSSIQKIAQLRAPAGLLKNLQSSCLPSLISSSPRGARLCSIKAEDVGALIGATSKSFCHIE
jgi:hypothetical protein